jgi:hypothetical protein
MGVAVIGEFAEEGRREGRRPWTPAGLAPLLGFFLRDRAEAPATEARQAVAASPEERCWPGSSITWYPSAR